IIQAPHTSNWDFILGIIAAKKTNLNFRFIIKNSWNIFIIGWALKRLGAIFIDRSKATGLTQQIIGELKKAESGHIVFTPEGTRSIVKKWKTGFYVVAHNAHIPIAVGYIDYKTKTIGINQLIYPTGDIKKDLTPIQRFYEKITPKNPTNYEPFWEI
ncbi:MAG: 1-acyl-sn-glycerol-3-phosphate acyltransferase, partial [Candidatus Margulisiibacteriota bacterium]